MFCRQCGTQAGDADTFCSKCGFDLKTGVVKEPPKKEYVNQKVYQPPTYSHINPQFASGTMQTKKVYGIGKIVSGIIMIIIGIILQSNASSVKNDASVDTLRYYFDSDYKSSVDMMAFFAVVLIIVGVILFIAGLIGKQEEVYVGGMAGGYRMPNSNGPTVGWRCAKCGRVNADYVGVCGCGNKK